MQPKLLIVAARIFSVDVEVPHTQAGSYVDAIAAAKEQVVLLYGRLASPEFQDLQLDATRYVVTLQVTQEY